MDYICINVTIHCLTIFQRPILPEVQRDRELQNGKTSCRGRMHCNLSPWETGFNISLVYRVRPSQRAKQNKQAIYSTHFASGLIQLVQKVSFPVNNYV